MKVRVFLSIGFAAANQEEELEMPDDLSESEIEDEVREWAHNYIEWSYERVEPPAPTEKEPSQ